MIQRFVVTTKPAPYGHRHVLVDEQHAGELRIYTDGAGRREFWAYSSHIEVSGNDNGNLGPHGSQGAALAAIAGLHMQVVAA